MNSIHISPSILAADFTQLGNELKAIEKSGASSVHIDIMDGHFVPKISFGPDFIKLIRKMTSLRLDVHLMVTNPEDVIEQSAQAGADRIYIHQESSPHNYRLLQRIRSLSLSPGIVLCPGTPATMIKELIGLVDSVLLMTVNPGLGGQKFLNDQLGKIRCVKKMACAENVDIELAVDGGINTETAPLVTTAGAQLLIAGSAIFKKENYKKAVNDLTIAAHA